MRGDLLAGRNVANPSTFRGSQQASPSGNRTQQKKKQFRNRLEKLPISAPCVLYFGLSEGGSSVVQVSLATCGLCLPIGNRSRLIYSATYAASSIKANADQARLSVRRELHRREPNVFSIISINQLNIIAACQRSRFPRSSSAVIARVPINHVVKCAQLLVFLALRNSHSLASQTTSHG